MIGVMPNGKPGDHPVTDITIHHLEVFGQVCDDLIRDICLRGGQAALPAVRLLALDPRFGGHPDLVGMEDELRRIRNQLPAVGD
jgi:hypothetical protein